MSGGDDRLAEGIEMECPGSRTKLLKYFHYRNLVSIPPRVAQKEHSSSSLREGEETHLVENLSSERCGMFRSQMLFDEFESAEEFLALHAAVLGSGVF